MTTSRERMRWARVKDVFDATVMQPAEERERVLREACQDDAALRAEVESLLDAHAQAGSFAEQPAVATLGTHAITRLALASGEEVGPYQILGPLGAGGMGEVYRALDRSLQREVAIKVLPAAQAGDPAWADRLHAEGRILAALKHPNIATIHGLVRTTELVAIVMELVDGPTLASRLVGGPLPVGQALSVARQIADALEAAHEQGFVHCDLKPANVTLTTDGVVKVLDFGLARLTARAMTSISDEAASDHGPAGTPAYMSPEQLRGEQLDARADVWAFGCLVYELLTGREAFGRATVSETLTAVLESDPDWTRLPGSVPEGIRRMLRRCVARDPRQRLRHVADARLEIEDALRPPERDAATQDSGRLRARGWVLAVVLLSGALVTALALLLRRDLVDPREPRVVEITTPRTPEPWSFTLSPDGRRIAYVAEANGQPVLWVRQLQAATARRLPGTEGARRPFWSPDSRTIGFFVASEIRRIDADGGPARLVAPALAATAASWGSDGTILYSGTGAPELYRVGASGGSARAVTTPSADSTGHRHPQFLPGGRDFLFFNGGLAALRGVFLGSLDSPGATKLVSADAQGAYLASGWLLFVRQGTLWAQRFDLQARRLSGEPVAVADDVTFDPIDGTAAFTVSGNGVVAYRSGRPTVTQFGWFDRAGRPIGVFGAPEQIGVVNPRLSPDGRRLAIERSSSNATDLWVLDADRQLRLTRASDGANTRLPVWSPGGDRIAYQSVRPGSIALVAKSSAGDGPDDVLYASGETKVPCDWSPDGRFLVYYVPTPKSGTDIWVLPLDGREPRVFLQTEANELWGQFSPDGRWMAYQSNETGRYEIYIRPFPSGGGPVPVSAGGGVYPRWSRDGRELYFVAPDATLMAARMRPGTTGLEAEAPLPLFRTRRLGGGLNVIARGPQYDVAADDRFLVNVDTQAVAPPITLLLDWTPNAAGARPSKQ